MPYEDRPMARNLLDVTSISANAVTRKVGTHIRAPRRNEKETKEKNREFVTWEARALKKKKETVLRFRFLCGPPQLREM